MSNLLVHAVLFVSFCIQVLRCSRTTKEANATVVQSARATGLVTSRADDWGLVGDTVLLEPLPYNQQFMARKDSELEQGRAVQVIEGIDMVTSHSRSRWPVTEEPKMSASSSSASYLVLATNALLSTTWLTRIPFPFSQESNTSVPTPEHDIRKEEARNPRPPTYALLSAIGASIGYIIMIIKRCKGFLDELAPKQQLAEFVLHQLECQRRHQSRHGKRQGKTRFCSSRAKLDVSISPKSSDFGSKLAREGASVPAPPNPLSLMSEMF
jgi:hypothetical protein